MLNILITTGLIIGTMTFLAVMILVEKLPKKIKPFVFGHHLATDILFSGIAFIVFPVTGAATLLSAATFCLLFTLYIFIRRTSISWKRFSFTGGRFKIEEKR